MHRTLDDVLNPSSNSLNFLRLVFAGCVIVSHAWPLSGREPEPSIGGSELGLWAVFGFFAISGYLITRSRLNGQRALHFYRARALRILPAFVVCLVVVAFGFAPLSLLFDPHGSWDPASAGTFVMKNLPLYPPNLFQGGIEGTLTSTPFLELWNGPLWTLFWEAACYVAVGVAVSILPRMLLRPALLVAAAGLTAYSLLGALDVIAINAVIVRVVPLVTTFILGALLFLYRTRLPVGPVTVVASAVVVVAASVAGLASPLALLPFAFLVLVVGGTLPLVGVGSRYDISYGIYIYGWPVQQTLALAFGPELPLPVFIALSLVLTAPLAWLSCVLIERPALALKRPTAEPDLSAPVTVGAPS